MSAQSSAIYRLLSVNVGLPRDLSWQGRTVRTAVVKSPVTERRLVRTLNIDGDGQADLEGHGGEHRAVFVYQMESYHYWEKVLGRSDFSFGQFGENFTVEGLPDDEVCIGDRYRIGDAEFEVTQPRVTCYRVGIRMNDARMPALLVAHRRPGFYLRVLQEGEVGAGDEIRKTADGPERLTVAQVDALLYLPGHSRLQVQRALRIPALSVGWQRSFQALLREDHASGPVVGNPGLASEAPAPAWSGFKAMRVARVQKESESVTSFVLVPVDARPVPIFKAGQFVVLRLLVDPGSPAILRSFSLSDGPGANHLRVSVKREANGIGSTFLCNRTQADDIVEVSAPRGTFTLRPGENPVALLSAGVGATPVLSMLHALAAEQSERQVWWIHGARNRDEHSFAQESRGLVQGLAHGQSCIVYSRPSANDRRGIDFDASGHISAGVVQRIGVPPSSDFYLCGPPPFLKLVRDGLRDWGVSVERVHAEVFGAMEGGLTPGMPQAVHHPHPSPGLPGPGPAVSFARSGIAAAWDPKYQSLLELAEACDIPVSWSCRTGVCHTCMTGLIGGSISYNPAPLEQPAPGNVLLCCSQPAAAVVLDI